MKTNKIHCFALLAIVAGVLLMSSPQAQAENPATWNFTLITSGQNVFWTSPTFVDPGWLQYDYNYIITNLEVDLQFFGWVGVTGEIPVEDRSGSGSVAGPLPVTLANDSFVYPDPPEPSSLAANVHIYIDGNGYGHGELTSVILGEYLGLDIEGIRIDGNIDVFGYGSEPPIIGDFDGDGDVDAFDFADWQANYPTASGATLAMGDANGDGDVDAFDFSYWQVNYPYPPPPEPTPEPATLGLMLLGGLTFLMASRRSLARL